MDYRKHYSTRQTPQSQPIPGTTQVPNSAGGYAWAVDDWTRLQRFLILGSEGGTYYIRERALTIDNADAVLRCLYADGPRVVETVVAVSQAGRAPKNDPALFVLAMAAAADRDTARRALAALPQVARTGTHLLHFAHFVEGFRGWGRGLREAFGRWYGDKSPEALAYQLVKYQSRDGWSHRDLLRLAHPVPPSDLHRALYGWAVNGAAAGCAGTLVEAFEAIKRADTREAVCALVRAHRLTHEMVPSQWLKEPEVWAALLEAMPMSALLRSLARMTSIGLLTPLSDAVRRVTEQLGDGERLRAARVHPLAVLSALRVYAAGHGQRGKGTWAPVPAIVDALDAAFYAAFGAVEPTGRRIVLALDVSGSMAQLLGGVPGLTCRDGAAAMALVTAATEPSHTIMAFATTFRALAVSPRQRLDDVVATMRRQAFGGTDCALPMIWAAQNRIQADAFVIYTDSETWFGPIHPVQALREYRQKLGIDAKLVVVAMTSNGFTIADPEDGGMLDVVGFDTAAPSVIGDFIADRLVQPAANPDRP